jgi:hypothetical protein
MRSLPVRSVSWQTSGMGHTGCAHVREADVAVQGVDTTMLFWRHGPVETDQDSLGAHAVKPGFPLRIGTLAACFPLRTPRSWSSS